jgi:hypothetical protein
MMKKLLVTMLLAMITVSGFAQAGFVPYKTKEKYVGLAADSLFYIPVKDTNYTPERLGALIMRPQDSCLYIGISTIDVGKRWERIAKLTDTDMPSWKYSGNSGLTNSNFIGTVDDVWLNFKQNNELVGRVRHNGGIYLGYRAGNVDTVGTTPWANSKNIGIGKFALSNFSYYDSNPASWRSLIAIGDSSMSAITGANTSASGNLAIGSLTMKKMEAGRRNTTVGNYSQQMMTSGIENAGLGVFNLEWNTTGQNNAAFGSNAMRHNTVGSYSTAVGAYALNSNSGFVNSITVTNGGTGYTTATVTISSPNLEYPTNSPSLGRQATATAVISSGAIIGINITDPGIRYTDATVTITGDGSGATATASIAAGGHSVAVGQGAGIFDERGYMNVYVGRHSGIANGGNESSIRDSLLTLIGTYSSRSSSLSNGITLSNSGALGYNSKVGKNNTYAIGAVGTATVIAGDTSRATGLDVPNGNMKLKGQLHINAYGGISYQDKWFSRPALRITQAENPIDSLQGGLLIEKYGISSGGGSIGFYRAYGDYPLHGAASSGGHVDLGSVVGLMPSINGASTRSAAGVLFHGYWGTETRNSGKIEFRTLAVNDACCGNSWTKVQMDSLGNFIWGIGTNGIAVNNTFNPPDASSVMDLQNTSKGILIPRMTAAQRLAISSPATALFLYDTDSSRFMQYNGSWKALSHTTDIPIVPNHTEGTYTPTLFNTTNVSASTAVVTYYTRSGDMIQVWGYVNITPTAGITLTEMGLEIPIASTITEGSLSGTASSEDNTTVRIRGDATNGRAMFRFTPASNSDTRYSFHYTYKYVAP